ncbi:MAG: UDP-3-O-(3-hydroxymyristoyl)glucosamine N-acyltransferase [Helicobacteraceae bacterium CG2_30_36_10]|nr:MAG: UDP-3-O-(3-hydroxymyristoyl)glucosamine N-acyltransferase [Helicobacteraceae bacterium CG2_30_36_10]
MKLSNIAKTLETEFSAEDIEITGMNALKDATSSEVSFVANSKYIKDIQDTKAAAVIVPASLVEYVPEGCAALVVENSYWSMAILSKHFAPVIEDDELPHAKIGEGSKISPKAEIAHGAKIGKNCTILAHVYIGAEAVVGDNTIIYPSVTVYRDCKIGSECIIHANTVIGADGFGFATNNLGEHKKIYQNGNVVIENDVEIGSNVSVDRAVFGTTLIKKGVRIDNLVQIGHNCEIGEYSVFVAQSGSAGSTKLGRNVVVGGQAAFAGHLEIAPFSTFAARSGITHNIKESGKTYGGFPLLEQRTWLKLQAKIARLLK